MLVMLVTRGAAAAQQAQPCRQASAVPDARTAAPAPLASQTYQRTARTPFHMICRLVSGPAGGASPLAVGGGGLTAGRIACDRGRRCTVRVSRLRGPPTRARGWSVRGCALAAYAIVTLAAAGVAHQRYAADGCCVASVTHPALHEHAQGGANAPWLPQTGAKQRPCRPRQRAGRGQPLMQPTRVMFHRAPVLQNSRRAAHHRRERTEKDGGAGGGGGGLGGGGGGLGGGGGGLGGGGAALVMARADTATLAVTYSPMPQ